MTKKRNHQEDAAFPSSIPRENRLIAINLKDDDQLIGIKETNGHNNVIIVTKNGKSICFSEEDVRSMGRIAGGVRAIKLKRTTK